MTFNFKVKKNKTDKKVLKIPKWEKAHFKGLDKR